MRWQAVLRDVVFDHVRLATEKDHGRAYPGVYEVHVMPCYQTEPLEFGVHEAKRSCVCRPRIETNGDGLEIVVHEDRKPN
jgi:hypothetical protein